MNGIRSPAQLPFGPGPRLTQQVPLFLLVSKPPIDKVADIGALHVRSDGVWHKEPHISRFPPLQVLRSSLACARVVEVQKPCGGSTTDCCGTCQVKIKSIGIADAYSRTTEASYAGTEVRIRFGRALKKSQVRVCDGIIGASSPCCHPTACAIVTILARTIGTELTAAPVLTRHKHAPNRPQLPPR